MPKELSQGIIPVSFGMDMVRDRWKVKESSGAVIGFPLRGSRDL